MRLIKALTDIKTDYLDYLILLAVFVLHCPDIVKNITGILVLGVVAAVPPMRHLNENKKEVKNGEEKTHHNKEGDAEDKGR